MRFVIYGIFLTLWMGMWWWTYTCHIKAACCPNGSVNSETELLTTPEDNRPVLFNWSEAEPIIGAGFVYYRDSVISLLHSDQILQITGRFDEAEEQPEQYENLGIARASQVLAVMAPQLDTGRYILKSALFDEISGSPDKPFTAVDIRLLTFNESIQEIDDRVLIYFPFNSTLMVDNPDIDAYLNKLVGYLNAHHDTVIFIGHSDAFGPTDSNYELGLWRASAMRDLLVEKGIDPSRIEVQSKGETEPIATNKTPAGAKKNRRVELQLIKSH